VIVATIAPAPPLRAACRRSRTPSRYVLVHIQHEIGGLLRRVGKQMPSRSSSRAGPRPAPRKSPETVRRMSARGTGRVQRLRQPAADVVAERDRAKKRGAAARSRSAMRTPPRRLRSRVLCEGACESSVSSACRACRRERGVGAAVTMRLPRRSSFVREVFGRRSLFFRRQRETTAWPRTCRADDVGFSRRQAEAAAQRRRYRRSRLARRGNLRSAFKFSFRRGPPFYSIPVSRTS